MLRAMSRALFHPSVDTFERERSSASLGRAIVGTLGIGLVTGFAGGWINLLLASGSIADIIVLTIMTPIRLIVGLLISQAFLLVAARALGGCGEFAEQAYLSSLVFAPLNALASLLASIPRVGAYLAVAVLAYDVLVTVPALQAAHGGRRWHAGRVVLVLLSSIAGLIAWLAISALSL